MGGASLCVTSTAGFVSNSMWRNSLRRSTMRVPDSKGARCPNSTPHAEASSLRHAQAAGTRAKDPHTRHWQGRNRGISSPLSLSSQCFRVASTPSDSGSLPKISETTSCGAGRSPFAMERSVLRARITRTRSANPFASTSFSASAAVNAARSQATTVAPAPAANIESKPVPAPMSSTFSAPPREAPWAMSDSTDDLMPSL
mmetsp:Transcript_47414/g.125209  ORF Transcript_47414/g.125209 Transcript_47414/m.125209 type:complete len:200 (-) Transcript_47414:786-1385(-)